MVTPRALVWRRFSAQSKTSWHCLWLTLISSTFCIKQLNDEDELHEREGRETESTTNISIRFSTRIELRIVMISRSLIIPEADKNKSFDEDFSVSLGERVWQYWLYSICCSRSSMAEQRSWFEIFKQSGTFLSMSFELIGSNLSDVSMNDDRNKHQSNQLRWFIIEDECYTKKKKLDVCRCE